MRFTLVDRIVDVVPGESITATKSLTLNEDYLKDHFPRFAVMPGVLMLEAMNQTAAWLIRISEDFAHSMVLMTEARNVKFTDFVTPGQTLDLTAEIRKQDDRSTWLNCEGKLEGNSAVKARLVMERFNLAQEHDESYGVVDANVIQKLRRKHELLCRRS